MGNAWETLRETVTSLSEVEASLTLEYISRLRAEPTESTLADLLGDDPSIHFPKRPSIAFPPLNQSAAPVSPRLNF